MPKKQKEPTIGDQIEQMSHLTLMPAPFPFDNNNVYLYTDGAISTKEKIGGWAFCAIYKGHMMLRYGFKVGSTSNEMELTAIARALDSIKPHSTNPVIVRSDSEYSINAVTKWYPDWKRGGWITASGTRVKNQELVEHIGEKIRLMLRTGKHVSVQHVKGHQKGSHYDAVYNNICDSLAVAARTRQITNFKE